VDISGTAGLGTLGKQNHAKSRCFAHTGANWCSIAAIAKALDITIPELADGVSAHAVNARHPAPALSYYGANGWIQLRVIAKASLRTFFRVDPE
jgi:hypothetical protein